MKRYWKGGNSQLQEEERAAQEVRGLREGCSTNSERILGGWRESATGAVRERESCTRHLQWLQEGYDN